MKKFIAFLLFFNVTVSSFGQCWKKIASEYGYVLAIHHDGSLWNWGGTQMIQRPQTTPQILDTNSWLDIATGNQFQLAIKSDGTLWSWGDNTYGQLGDGTNTNHWTPTQIGTDTNWKQVSCGFGQSVALKTDGTLWLWGQNNYGQLGLGTNRMNRNVPMQLGTDSDWVFISAGTYHSLVKKSNHSVWFVGACYNSENSQIHAINASTDWKDISAGPYIDYGIKQNGTLWKWAQSGGSNTTPTQIGTQNDWNKLDNSQSYSQEAHALFLKNNGSLWSIGFNNFGQLGNASIAASSTNPVQVGTETDWLEVYAGNGYSFSIKNNYTFWAWGRNNYAQFGNGKNRNTLQAIDSTSQWKSVVSGKGSYNAHSLGIQTDGSLWAWGQNNDGQLGIGSTYTHQILPVQVGSATNWSQVSNGFHFSIGIRNDGSLWSWGRNGRGQLGLGQVYSTQSSPMRVGTDTNWLMSASGSEFVVAIKNDGTLWSWGYNFDGQLGMGNTTTVYTPTQIGTDSNWVFVSSGENFAMALKSDSTLWTWGNNSYGQLGRTGSSLIPQQVGSDRWMRIAGGGLHALGIKADSSLWTWGYNLYSQLGDGGSSSRTVPVQIMPGDQWVEVTGGYEHSLALRSDHSLWGWGRNGSGQLADPLSYPQFLSTADVPVQIGTQHHWSSIDAGNVNSCILDSNGILYTCGDNWVSDFQINFPQLAYVFWTPQQINSCSYCLPSASSFNLSLCNGDSVFFNGTYRTISGIYTDTLLNLMNCDSIVTLNLHVFAPITGTEVVQACEFYTWIDGNAYTVDTNSAVFTLVGAAANGCDSTVTLNLTIKQPASGLDVQTACDSFTWLDGNVYTSNNNTATHRILGAAANGCDSILTLNLTMNYSSTAVDHQFSCGPFTWIDGLTYTASNQSAVHTLTNAAGCDSIVSLDLQLVNLDLTLSTSNLTLTSNENGAQYQWLDCANGYLELPGAQNQSLVVNANGQYAVLISNNGCTDTSECVLVDHVALDEHSLSDLFQLVPNPTEGNFVLQFDGEREAFLTILDVQGREIQSMVPLQGKSFSMKLDEPAGIYFVLLQFPENQSVMLKLIRQ